MKVTGRKSLNAAGVARIGEEAAKKDAIRQLRAPLLAAFDVYKSNVFYGVIEEDAETHEAVLAWYRALLEKDPAALTDVPAGVRPYVKGGAA